MNNRIGINKRAFSKYISANKYSNDLMIKQSEQFYNYIKERKSIRDFSDEQVPQKIIENCIKAAGTAPSGANLQPWYFVVISDTGIKKKIRIAAEKEEREFYRTKAPKQWLEALRPLGTNENKPFLETAPYIIAVFYKNYDVLPNGKLVKQYYAIESTGIACGILITAIHNAGLVSLTHTPSPMKFLNKILNRPKNEKPFLLLVVGHPAKDALIPDLKKKSLDKIASFI